MTSLAPDIAARLKQDAQGLVPAVVQQHDSGEVLMLGWMDDEALHHPHLRAYDVLEPLPASTGSRSLRPPPARQGGPPRLRRGHPARQGRPGRACLPLAPAPASTPTSCRWPMAERPRSRSFGPTVPGRSGRRDPGGCRLGPRLGRRVPPGRGSRGDRGRQGIGVRPARAGLGLVALAAWGVVLVVRARTRRFVSALGALASAGMIAATVVAFAGAQNDAIRALDERGVTGDV